MNVFEREQTCFQSGAAQQTLTQYVGYSQNDGVFLVVDHIVIPNFGGYHNGILILGTTGVVHK